MKTSHVIFFLILFLILRSKTAAPPAGPAPTITSGGGTTDATLRRDMDEQISRLQSQIDDLKNSPYA